MEKMRQEVKEKINYWTRMVSMFTSLMALNCIVSARSTNGGDGFPDFFSGFQLGISIAITLYAIKMLSSYRRILNDDEAIRTFYIKNHDERIAAINAKSGGTALYTCGVLIIGASIVAGYFNEIVFVSLLGCGVFLLIVKKGLGIYYCKKM